MENWFNFDLKGEVNFDNILSTLTATKLGLLLVIIVGSIYLLRKWEIKSEIIKGLIALGLFAVFAYVTFKLLDVPGTNEGGAGNDNNISQKISGMVRVDGTINPIESAKLIINLAGQEFTATSRVDGSYQFSGLKGKEKQAVRIFVEKEGFKLSGGEKSIPTNLGKTDVPIYLEEVGK